VQRGPGDGMILATHEFARFEHALVVGGTGMLADAARFLRDHSKWMTLVSRSAKLRGLSKQPDNTCAVDWHDFAAFSAALGPCMSATPPDVALLWMHSDAWLSLLWLLGQLATRPVLIVHVVGSSWSRPPGGDHEIGDVVVAAGAKYVNVVLGSKALPNGRRQWLTNSEIGSGAIEAIQTARDVMVGEMGPAR